MRRTVPVTIKEKYSGVKMDFRLILLTATVALTSCASGSKKVSHNFPQKQNNLENKTTKTAKKKVHSEEIQKLRQRYSAIEKPIVKETVIVKKKFVNRSITDFKLNYYDRHFDFWVKYFSGKSKDRFLRFLKRGRKYEDIIAQVFKEEGLPQELFYVGLIESGYSLRAKSHASAVGPWQFIKGTGKRYGLRIDRQVDERKSIYKSTRAAARYFKDLYNIFGSWELALCAYNAGEYRIIRAIRKGNTRDYRTLVEKRLIPRETINYVPKVAAAKYLASKKNFQVRKPAEAIAYNNAKEVDLNSSFSLKSFAKHSGISRKVLKRFNPDIRWDWVKVRRRPFTAYVPEQLHTKALAYSKTRMNKRSFDQVETGLERIYRVRKGDNLSNIARRHGLTVNKLKKLNKIRSSRIFPGQRLVVSGSQKKIYVVRRGDNLYQIAKRFGTSIRQILRLNNLKKKTIYPAQKLWVPTKNVL